jgi:hypothetical protein
MDGFVAFAWTQDFRPERTQLLEQEAIPLPEKWDAPTLDRAVFEPYKTVVTD